MPLPTAAPDGPLADTVGPLNALEADRYVEELKTFEFGQFGDARWMNQHEFLTKLNMQAHVNASQQRDEFVLEAVVLHEKMPLLIRELIATELWKANAYPLLKDWLAENNSVKGYLLLYNEGVLTNLLEALMYHKEGCEACGDLVVELVDYCHRKLTHLMGVTPPDFPADKEEYKKRIFAESETDNTSEQQSSINMQCALCCLSIVRFLTDHIDSLPLAVTSRILDTYDMLMLLCPLLEIKPWQTDGADGEHRRFLQGHWARVPENEVRKLSKHEAQCWLAVYNLVLTPSVRKRYQFNSFRKNNLLRVRKFLHETTVDQIPILVDLMRALDEMLMQDPPSAAEIKPAYVLEQLPELRDSLQKDVDWKAVVEEQKKNALNDSEEEKRSQAMQLAGVFDLEGMDELMAAETGANEALMREREMSYYLQVAVSEGQGYGEKDKEILRIVAESEDGSLAPQSTFVIPSEDKQKLIPTACGGSATVTASLNLGSGAGQSFECKGTLELVEGRKKQWLQLGFDPYGLRVQLHILTLPDGAGYHIIHTRVTAPPPCLLTLTFVGKKQGETLQIRAKGRGVCAQTPFEVDALDSSIRVPKLSSCSAKLLVNVGAGDAERAVEAPSTDLALSSASQMVWRQLGTEPSSLRIQLKLAPTTEGGFQVTAIRVTPPSSYRQPGSTKHLEAASTNAAAATPPQEEKKAPPAPPPAKPHAPPPPAKKPPPPSPPAAAVDDDDEPRIVEVEESPSAVRDWARGKSETQTPPAAPVAPPFGNDGTAAFVASSEFAGARPGYVFKRGGEGLGYYKDRALATNAKGVSKVSFVEDKAAPEKPASPTPTPVDQASASMKSAADALFAKGDAAGAALSYTSLLERMPPSTQLGHTALSNRSACYLAQQEWSKCAADCDEALRTARSDLPAKNKVKLHLRRAEARLSLGLRELAGADVRDAEQLRTASDTAAGEQIAAFKKRLAATPAQQAQQAAAVAAASKDFGAAMDLEETRASPRADVVPAASDDAKPKVDLAVVGDAPSRSLTLNVSLPGVRTLADITLEISNTSVHVHGAGFALDEPLPFAVDSASASAKFSSKVGVLRVKAPEAS